jgi:hypothetical protein
MGQNAGIAAKGGNGGSRDTLVSGSPEDFTDDFSGMRLPFRSNELERHSAAMTGMAERQRLASDARSCPRGDAPRRAGRSSIFITQIFKPSIAFAQRTGDLENI